MFPASFDQAVFSPGNDWNGGFRGRRDLFRCGNDLFRAGSGYFRPGITLLHAGKGLFRAENGYFDPDLTFSVPEQINAGSEPVTSGADLA